MELNYIDQLLSKGRLTRQDMQQWLHDHPLMLRHFTPCERQKLEASVADAETQDGAQVQKNSSGKTFVRNQGHFLSKYIRNSNNNNNKNLLENKSNSKVAEKDAPESKNRVRKFFFSFHSKAPSSSGKKLSRSISAQPFAISYFRRKSAS